MQAPQFSIRETNLSLPVGFWLEKTKLTRIAFLLSHLTRFVTRLFAGHPCFRLRSSIGLTISLAISGVILIVGIITVSYQDGPCGTS